MHDRRAFAARGGGIRTLRWRAPRGFWAYVLLQLPDILLAGVVLLLLHRWGVLASGWALGLFVLWVAKDVAMYPWLRDVFGPPRVGPETLVGTRGLSRGPLAPEGHVQLGGELWWARSLRSEEPIAPGTPVVVRATRGLTLLVEPAGSPETPNGKGGAP